MKNMKAETYNSLKAKLVSAKSGVTRFLNKLENHCGEYARLREEDLPTSTKQRMAAEILEGLEKRTKHVKEMEDIGNKLKTAISEIDHKVNGQPDIEKMIKKVDEDISSYEENFAILVEVDS